MGPKHNNPIARPKGRVRVSGVRSLLITGCILAAGLSSGVDDEQTGTLQRFTYTEYHMGVDARIVVYAKDKTTAENACAAAFARMAELDALMSDYRPDSELMRLCDKAGGPPVRVSPELFKVLKVAEEISSRSDGTFDVTVGPLVKLWRAARKSHVLPDGAEIEKARKLVGWRHVKLDERAQTVRLEIPGMRLDFGGIAKGYADDEAQAVLRKFGIKHALVEMGGDIVVTDAPPGTPGWTIRVPNAGDDHGPADVTFANRAISTSGDTEQFVVIGGKRYSHVVDPRTGWALTSRAQATVVSDLGLYSDPLSKCMTILDHEARVKLLKSYKNTTSYIRVAKDESR